MISAAVSPALPPESWGPSPSPTPSPNPSTAAASIPQSPPAKLPIDFSPPLIAMVVVVAAAFLVVTYSRLISRYLLPPLHRLSQWYRRRRRRRRRRSYLPSSVADLDSPPYYDSPFRQAGDSFPVISAHGLDDSVIKTIPLSLYTSKLHTQNRHGFLLEEDGRDCAVCLLEFEDNDYVRTLPVCSHAFHVECIDAWLRSHANCPLCRAGIFQSPFIPVMAARIRPSLDETILQSLTEIADAISEITPVEEEPSPRNTEDRFTRRDFLLKRSYSFGFERFERSLVSERMVMEPATASPWRYRRGGSFWSKRPSPFGSSTKNRVFSFRQYRGIKSPFFRRRNFFPLSESSVRFSGGGSGSSRRSKSMTSPMFTRSSAMAAAAAFSSSRLRCGDPEALLSPERL